MNAISFRDRPNLATTIVNGLSVDVEDWFQVGAFEKVIDRDAWDSLPLRVEDNVLRISGEKRAVREEGDGTAYRLTERRYGRFERSFRVPANVSAEEVTARYENGVLMVRLPRTEESRPRRIRVESGNGARQVTTGENA